ncbi:MAG: hypothetical protein ACLUFI_13480 [Oscillospiraceae bacterium]
MAVDGSFAGFLALSDTLRQESAETIAALIRPRRAAGLADTATTKRSPDHRREAADPARCGQTACRRIS